VGTATALLSRRCWTMVWRFTSRRSACQRCPKATSAEPITGSHLWMSWLRWHVLLTTSRTEGCCCRTVRSVPPQMKTIISSCTYARGTQSPAEYNKPCSTSNRSPCLALEFLEEIQSVLRLLLHILLPEPHHPGRKAVCNFLHIWMVWIQQGPDSSRHQTSDHVLVSTWLADLVVRRQSKWDVFVTFNFSE
jgi:hypothetical protein